MHVLHVVGARPNFMKAAPVIQALTSRQIGRQTLVHTGQHYDVNMSDVFFEHLGMRAPDVNLEVGSGSHARQTAEAMKRLEQTVLERAPDIVLVYGDVNSTLAGALVCAKLLVPVGHVEAGLRSFDLTMPEEINRLLSDQIADLLFTPSLDGNENLAREGVAPEKVHFVGNVMIDTLVRLLPEASARWTSGGLGPIRPGDGEAFGVVTLHRPSNVDDQEALGDLIHTLDRIGTDVPLVFPVHPRTRKMIVAGGHESQSTGLRLTDPLGYLDFLALQSKATLVITDSAGVQEESTYLGVPCLTLRKNTERPVTETVGTNTVVGQDLERLEAEVALILEGKAKSGGIPELWDGRAAERIAEIIQNWGPG